MELRWSVVWQYRDLLWAGVQVTIFIATIAMILAMVGGLLFALARLSTFKPLAWFAAVYINVFRAIPQLVFIVYIYYGVSIVTGVNFEPITAGIVALSMQYSAWLAEIFRAGIQSVPKGQLEAALSIGMGRIQAFMTIVLPQAFRNVIPPTGNMAVGMIKDSSLVSIIGVFELLRRTQILISQTFRPFEFYTAIVLIYLLLTLAVAGGVRLIEKKYTLVDPLAATRPARGPLAIRRLKRLQSLQERVRQQSL